MKHILTTCIYCGCGCGLYLVSDGKKIIGSYPSKNHPVSRGSLCVKGWNSYEFINKRDRLVSPLIKINDTFHEADWASALSLTSDRLREISQMYGPDSIAFLSSAKATNEENYLMMKLARAVFKTNNIDNCARLCHAPTVVGLTSTFGSGAMTNTIEEFEDADVVLVTGSDTCAQHPLIGTRIINVVLDKKTKLIVIDPRKNQLSKYATIYASQTNGTDVAWINGMINIIILENLYSIEYVRTRVEGFEILKKQVSEYTPEKVSSITSIPEKKLIEMAHLYAKAKKAMIVYAMGITQHVTGVDNVQSLTNLAMITGHVGFICTGVNPLRGQNNVQGACDMGALPDVFPGYQHVSNESVRNKFEALWDVDHLPGVPGLTAMEIMNRAETGQIKGLFIFGENPILSDPDINHVKKALKNLEFLVVQDIFLSETAEFADVVLAGSSFAEKDGTFTSTERRCQRVRKAIDCPGNSREDWKIICDVAIHCGYNGMNYSHPSEIMNEITRVTPIYAGMGYNRLDPWGLLWPCPNNEHPGTKILHEGTFSKGIGTFKPCRYEPPDELPDMEYNFILTTGRVYFHWHTGTMTRRTSVLEREFPECFVELNPENAKELGLKSGDIVKVSSRRGFIEVKVNITENIQKNSIFIPFHFMEAAANILTNPALDPIAKIPEYKVCAVKVEKV
jgi:formate dehydrogenase alpha subunit